MVGLVRTVLVWLLVLALPAQGLAAATMAFCNPNHHSTAGMAPPSHHGLVESDQHARHHGNEHTVAHAATPHDHSRPAQHRSHGDGHAADSAGAVSASDEVAAAGGVSATKLAHADKHNCSACASCCSAAAFSSAVLKVPAPGAAPTVFILIVLTVEKFASDGPDRPPRVLFV